MSIQLLRPQWDVPVNAGCTLRAGGVSKPPYNSFNLALHVGDDPEAVWENRRRLLEQAALPAMPRWLNQVHGTKVVYAGDVMSDETPADAVWADQPDQVCAVMVADCVPVLIAAQDGRCVAAAHAGWRGLVNGVLQATLAALPAKPEELAAWVGPCIGPGAYTVSPDIIESFGAMGVAGKKPNHLDIAATAAKILENQGIPQIHQADRCVFANGAEFYSYRRDGVTGRFAAFVGVLGTDPLPFEKDCDN